MGVSLDRMTKESHPKEVRFEWILEKVKDWDVQISDERASHSEGRESMKFLREECVWLVID